MNEDKLCNEARESCQTEKDFILGQKVKFKKFIKRSGCTGLDSDYDNLTESEKAMFDDGPFFIDFRGTKECKKTTGLIVGKRKVCVGAWFSYEESYWEYEGETSCQSVVARDPEYKTVYLVACNLSGFKRVYPEDLEAIELDN